MESTHFSDNRNCIIVFAKRDTISTNVVYMILEARFALYIFLHIKKYVFWIQVMLLVLPFLSHTFLHFSNLKG